MGGAFGIAAFLFNGGIAGFQLLSTGKWLDYQGEATIAWKSIPLAMFVTQRGLLYAIPAGVLLLYQWRAKYFPRANDSKTDSARAPLPFWVECSLYATMPLFHLHTFIALSITLGFWFRSQQRDSPKTAPASGRLRIVASYVFCLAYHRSLSGNLRPRLENRLGATCGTGQRIRKIVFPVLVLQFRDRSAACPFTAWSVYHGLLEK